MFGGQKLIFIQRLFVLCPATHKVKFPYQKFPCTRPSSVVRNISMEGTHHLPTLYNAMQCSVRRAPGNMSMEGTHTFPPCTMPCSAVSGGHQVTCQWRGHPLPPPPPFPPCTMPHTPPSHPVKCHAVQCQEGTR